MLAEWFRSGLFSVHDVKMVPSARCKTPSVLKLDSFPLMFPTISRIVGRWRKRFATRI